MKRNLRIQAVLALIFLISILSCASVSVVETTENEGPAPRIEDLGEGELIASYAGEHIPARVAKDGDRWFMICQLYLSKDYSFSASDQPDGIDVKYEGEGTVWNLSASEGSAVWCERGKDLSRILLYDGAADEVREIARLATDAEKVQLAKTYIRSGHVYYSEIDYDRDKFLIHDYELASGER